MTQILTSGAVLLLLTHSDASYVMGLLKLKSAPPCGNLE